MGMEEQLDGMDGVALGELIRNGDLTARELFAVTRKRISAVNGQINAVVEHLDDIAEQCLTESENAPQQDASPLAGLPIFLKALFSACEGAPLSAASKSTEGLISPHDSAVTSRLKKAGGIVCGMTNSPEFGINTSTESQYYGPARNPWGEKLSTGGSSGGAAAAVAAGIVPVAHATDGGGSIRIPAACCGLVGLKPSRGRVSFSPGGAESSAGMSYNNCVSRTVRDSAAFLDILSGCEPGDAFTAPPNSRPFLEEVGANPGSLKIGLCLQSFNGEKVDAQCLATVRKAAQLCEALGHNVIEIEPAHDAQAFWPDIERVFAVNVAQSLDALGQMRGKPIGLDEIETNTAQMWEIGKAISGPDYVALLGQMNVISRQVAGLFSQVDVILTPTMSIPDIPLGQPDTSEEDRRIFDRAIRPTIAFTALFNVTGMPAISLPLLSLDKGTPTGIHFAAPYGGEATLIRLAAQLEEAHPWAQRRPPIFAGTESRS